MTDRRYLFFDLENATCEKRNYRICEFGYVVTDEAFRILERDLFLIDPNLQEGEKWDRYVVKNILTRDKSEYKNGKTFLTYYRKIASLFEQADIVLGHTLGGDADSLNVECARYALPQIKFDYYDVKEFYKPVMNTTADRSVVNMMIELGITGDEKVHNAESDAYNTMLIAKALLARAGMTLERMIANYPKAKGCSERRLTKKKK